MVHILSCTDVVRKRTTSQKVTVGMDAVWVIDLNSEIPKFIPYERFEKARRKK